VPAVEERLRALSPENPVVVIENRVHPASGAVRWMQFINRARFDASGRVVELQSVGRDITAQKEAEEVLRRYGTRLIEADELLRRSLASELHDEVGRDVTALGLNLGILRAATAGAPGSQTERRFEDSLRLVADISRALRGLLARLRPPMLDDQGLASALRWHADLFRQRTGLDVALEVAEPFPRLSADKELALFRIAQEAMMNVSKHAGARAVAVELAARTGRIRLRIVDDGRGLDEAAARSGGPGHGWGLTIMRERALSVGGRFELNSLLGMGVCIDVEVPEGS
jgi:signal transduction histidine kinase